MPGLNAVNIVEIKTFFIDVSRYRVKLTDIKSVLIYGHNKGCAQWHTGLLCYTVSLVHEQGICMLSPANGSVGQIFAQKLFL